MKNKNKLFFRNHSVLILMKSYVLQYCVRNNLYSDKNPTVLLRFGKHITFRTSKTAASHIMYA